MRRLFVACAVAALAGACSPSDDAEKAEQKTAAAVPATQEVAGPIVPVATEAPSGDYTLDKSHASVIFRVNHIGFSNYTAQFTGLDARLKLDVKDPTLSSLTATVDTKSLLLNAPPAGFLDKLLSEKWLGAAPMTFRSTKIEMTGANTARVTGDLTLRGVTHPVVLETTFNGGYAGHPYDPQARIGFSARGSLKRTLFGVSEGVPPPGSTMGVGDDVSIEIETEFNGPKLATPPAGTTP
jgi:polyisoprenoid-binding protein YceI